MIAVTEEGAAAARPSRFSPRYASSLRRHWLLIAIVVLGALERIAWNALRPTSGASGEAMHIASAIGAGRGFADAYRVAQGPTAHMLPTSPLLAGLVYRALGVGSPAAEVVLACWSIGLALATYCLLYRAFARLDTPRWARIGGLAFGCLAPAYLGSEAVDFRVWEGGLAAMLTALLLDRLLAFAQAPRGWCRITLLAALNALLFFVNPPLGVACYCANGWLLLRRCSLQQMAGFAGLSALTLALLVGPWAWRNHVVLGRTILLRDNAGLELALANYPGAAEGDHRAKFLARLAEIHPAVTEQAYARMIAAGGEASYAEALGNATKQWMAAHPRETAELALLHLRQSLVPQPWQFDVFGRALSPLLRAALTDSVGLLGLFGLVVGLLRGCEGWLYPALIVAAWALLTSLFQPATRYTYLVYPLMLFCAAYGIAWITRSLEAAPRIRLRR